MVSANVMMSAEPRIRKLLSNFQNSVRQKPAWSGGQVRDPLDTIFCQGLVLCSASSLHKNMLAGLGSEFPEWCGRS
jgi:hypothetical protein